MAPVLKDKVIAITGGARGIGLALARRLAEQGAVLSLADVQKENLDEAGALLARIGAKVMATQVDVRDTQQVNAWIADTVKAFGRLDGAVNMAGVFNVSGNIKDITDDSWDHVTDINVKGTLKCMRAELNAMEATGGSIVNAASTAGLESYENFAAYCASKAAVISLTRTAAKESALKKIRVNAVAPGWVNTDMKKDLEAVVGHYIPPTNPMKREAEADEVARVVEFLLSDDASFVNGTTVSVDGGAMA